MFDDSSEMDPTRKYVPGDSSPPVPVPSPGSEIFRHYQKIIGQSHVCWEMDYRLVRRLGAGGQGVVFLADREGAFGVSFPLALKFYRPDGYVNNDVYRDEMARLARMTMDVARIQQDHLMDVYNVVEYQGILVLVSEWIDGYDLRFLTAPPLLRKLKRSVDRERWDYINEVVMTDAGFQSRLMPGVAIAIIRECLAGLAALHRQDIIHADLKPANVMVKQTGNCKIIDLGSAFQIGKPPQRPTWTPRYAAVEVLKGEPHTPLSDLASLGYVLLELLSGKYPFAGVADDGELIHVKQTMWETVPELLPADVARNGTLIELIRKMIAPNPADRFTSLEEADLSECGAAEILRQLVKVNMTTEAESELRLLMEEISVGEPHGGNEYQRKTG
ncbi:MAG: serine/threonine protein kinase [Planctomycetaceae bacterium]|nr:serine/threonine protein kinase [Planctomycetaceae bacterium]